MASKEVAGIEEDDEMTIADTLLAEFDQEMAATRRVIERIPDGNPGWKPHPKSFSIAHLGQLVAGLPGWIGQTLTSTELDLAKGAGYSDERTQDLLAMFDENVRRSRDAITAGEGFRLRRAVVAEDEGGSAVHIAAKRGGAPAHQPSSRPADGIPPIARRSGAVCVRTDRGRILAGVTR